MTASDHRPGAKASVVIVACLGLAAVLGVLLILSLSHKGDQAQDTAKKAQRGVATQGDHNNSQDKKIEDNRRATTHVTKLVHTTIYRLGVAGIDGLPGRTGTKGPPGITGAQGPPGKDAVFPFTLTQLLDGLSPRLVERLPSAGDVANACGDACIGPQGERGPEGPKGDTGPAGVDGATGPQGATGPAGATGADGAQGPAGATGAQGPGPTDAQVQAAVDAYCAAHNNCAPPPIVP